MAEVTSFNCDGFHVIPGDGDTLYSQHVNGLLQLLLDEGRAEQLDQGYLVKHEEFCRLGEEDLILLGAPAAFPYQIEVSARGDFSDVEFHYIVSFIDSDGSKLFAPERIGSIVRIGSRKYLLSEAQYSLLEDISVFNAIDFDENGQRSDQMVTKLERHAELKKWADDCGCLLDDYLKTQKIIVPDRIRPIPEFNEDGSIEIQPIPIQANMCRLSEEEICQYSRSTIERRQPRKIVQLRALDGSTKKIVNSPEVRKGLSELSSVRHLDPQEAADFIENPHSYLTSEIFDLDDFSSRVIEVAQLQYRSNPVYSSGNMRIDWNSLQLSFDLEGDEIGLGAVRVDSPADLRLIEAAVARAKEQKQDRPLYKGALLNCDMKELEAFIEAKRDYFIADGMIKGDNMAAMERLQSNDRIADVAQLGLRIFDNLTDSEQFKYTEQQLGAHTDYRLPEALASDVDLYEFQKKGVLWLQSQNASASRGALLADDMGLGKTLQVLCYISSQIEAGVAGPFLVVAPVSILENWRRELQSMFTGEVRNNCMILHQAFLKRFGRKGTRIRQRDGSVVELPNKKTITEEGLDLIRNCGIVITNYATVRTYQLSLGQIEFAAIICDEAQRIKNPTTHVTNAVKAMNGQFRVATTATPVENSLQDLWCIADFLSPGLLGSLSAFSRDHIPAKGESIAPGVVSSLRRRLDEKCLILRRTKEEELPGLPIKTEVREYIPLSPRQLSLYSEMIDVVRRDPSATISILLGLIALCSHPDILTPGEFRNSGEEDLLRDSTKLSWTINKLKAIRSLGEKVIIFTRFRRMQQILLECIMTGFNDEIRPSIINGRTPAGKRQTLVDAFNQSRGFSVLILSPEAAGVGLNITGANHVIHFTRLWNPAKEDQATDRAYRIGQDKDVTVYYPIIKDDRIGTTIEEHIDSLLGAKREVMRLFLTPTDAFRIKDEELMHLLLDSNSADTPLKLESLSIDEMKSLSDHELKKAIVLVHRRSGQIVEEIDQSANFGVHLVVRNQDSGHIMLVHCQTDSSTAEQTEVLRIMETASTFFINKYDADIDKLILYSTKDVPSVIWNSGNRIQTEVLSGERLLKIIRQAGVLVADLVVVPNV